MIYPDLDFLPIPDPWSRIEGSKKAPVPGSRSVTLGCGEENIIFKNLESQYLNNTIVEAEMMFTQRRLEQK
jgi:hypothetical protein